MVPLTQNVSHAKSAVVCSYSYATKEYRRCEMIKTR